MQPSDESYELPTLAKIGVRYSVAEGATDRTFTDVGDHRVYFWCEAADRKVEIVHPTAFDLLLWDMCVRLGFCGGVVNDKPTHVTDLLPTTGMVTAEEFAASAIRAENDVQSPPAKHDRWMAMLTDKFLEHMGAPSVPASALTRQLANPFD